MELRVDQEQWVRLVLFPDPVHKEHNWYMSWISFFFFLWELPKYVKEQKDKDFGMFCPSYFPSCFLIFLSFSLLFSLIHRQWLNISRIKYMFSCIYSLILTFVFSAGIAENTKEYGSEKKQIDIINFVNLHCRSKGRPRTSNRSLDCLLYSY